MGKLTESDLMRHLMDNIRDNIYFMDQEGRIILINKEGARWLGHDSPSELVGKTDLDIFTDEHGRAAYEDEQRIMKTGIPVLGKEEKETWVDGRETWVSTSKMPLCDKDGEVVGTFGISRDITEHKESEIRAEKLAEENRCFREKMETELQMAAELQKSFFPTSYPEFPEGASEEKTVVLFNHLHHASEQVGGDFCSIRKLSETEVGILLCDVMGHGVRAALGTAVVRGVVEEISQQKKDPGEFLTNLNRVLMPIMRQGGQFLFATACYMVLDVSTGLLRFSIAGHPSPILYNDEEVRWLGDEADIGAPALAISEDTCYSSYTCELLPADSILMYTDGIYETLNKDDEEFGQDRLLQAIRQYKNKSLPDLYAQLLHESSHFAEGGTIEDDVCLAGFRLNGVLQG